VTSRLDSGKMANLFFTVYEDKNGPDFAPVVGISRAEKGALWLNLQPIKMPFVSPDMTRQISFYKIGLIRTNTKPSTGSGAGRGSSSSSTLSVELFSFQDVIS
jgi:hypothetical protein